ncbi:MAG: patatin family protein [Saprospiraceae bacterium]|nr:patatin family protein [Saprospiraceae bacterium]
MKALVCEGGGFKTAFTTGVLDAWIASDYFPFDIFIGVSGGAVVMSSYISRQYKRGWELMEELLADRDLTSVSRFVKGGYYLELDLIEHVWDKITPFDNNIAASITKDKIVKFVCTHARTGNAIYISPDIKQWKYYLRASSALPFVSKCPVIIDKQELVDGFFVDPLPVKHAIDIGATEITVIRTNRNEDIGSRFNQLLSGYLLKSDFPVLDKLMKKEKEIYTKVVSLLKNPPKGVAVNTILPDEILSGRLTSKPKALKQDYLQGLEKGLDYLKL